MKKIQLTTVVIPVYNGAKTITGVVEELISIFGSNNFQIVLVNDGSQDNSHEICLSLSEKHHPVVTYINLAKNFGEHNAVMAGLNYAEGDYVVIMDDDFQNPPSEAQLLVNEAITKQYDIVYSYYKKKEHYWLRNIGSKFNNWVANFMLDKPTDLYLSSFKCISRFVVQEVIKYKGPFPYIDGLALRCTKNIGKIEVCHRKREEGRSGYTLSKSISLWRNMFVNFSIVPLRLSLALGLIFSCLGAFFCIVVIIEKILNPSVPIGWSFLAIVIMLFSGVQLLILGLLGEYLGHLFLSYNQTPQFIIRQIYKVGAKNE